MGKEIGHEKARICGLIGKRAVNRSVRRGEAMLRFGPRPRLRRPIRLAGVIASPGVLRTDAAVE